MRQFTAINCTTALASDGCAFNSRFNLETFLAGVQKVVKFATDMKIPGSVNAIRQKSVVLYPGMDYSFIDEVAVFEKDGGAPIIVWNHRWEHDKGPEIFFDALYTLQKKKIAFRLIVLGESYVNMPECFTMAKERLADEILHFGFAESRKRYAELLSMGDVLVSTARHEFYGIAVLEGIRAGCYPLLPESLSYPELYEKEFLYTPGKLAKKLEGYLRYPMCLEREARNRLTERFSWNSLQGNYAKWLLGNGKPEPMEKT